MARPCTFLCYYGIPTYPTESPAAEELLPPPVRLCRHPSKNSPAHQTQTSINREKKSRKNRSFAAVARETHQLKGKGAVNYGEAESKLFAGLQSIMNGTF